MAKKPAAEAVVSKKGGAYLVLARKYRPQNFAEMKGQDALVRTLSNAIETGRLAHAFMLTGVRGVGKTTTARIIARALNCETGPTISPCGVCEQCRAIAEDRHVDVLELDAASRNGVDEVREIIDQVQYAPVSARYKIFILDEVHMLSKPAFNALLKTLEEPPPHVKFIFATTEIRKVPVTVLSRCQRFDLKRIGADVLEKYFGELLQKEKLEAEQPAIALIARAADGSARDGLSLLDQAIARSPDKITEQQMRDMLGLADRAVTFDLFETVMKGDSVASLSILSTLYKSGADPLMVLQDMAELTHFLTKVKVAPDLANDTIMPEAERVRGGALAQKLSMPVLARTWQMLLKGAQEVHQASSPQLALEMLVIRLLYASEQPTPGDVLKQLKDGSTVSMGGGVPSGASSGGARPTIMSRTSAAAAAAPAYDEAPQLNSFQDVVALFGQKREALLQAHLQNFVHPVKYEQGHLAVRLKAGAPQNLIGQVSEKLSLWTGARWVVSLSREEGEATLSEKARGQKESLENEVKATPLVAEVLKVFPGAKILDIRTRKP